MHYGGYLVDLVAWRKFADENGLCWSKMLPTHLG